MIKINLLKDDATPKRRGNSLNTLITIGFILVAAGITIVGIRMAGNRPKPAPLAAVEKKIEPAPVHETLKTEPIAAKPTDTTAASVAPPPEIVTAPHSSGLEKQETASAPPVKTEPKTAVHEKPVSAEKSVAAPETGKSGFTPSTHAAPEGVEDVVIDRNRRSGSELLSLTYAEMSPGEKINYEIAFSKKVFEIITRAVPEGVEFNSMVIDSFSVIKAVGIGPRRDLVAKLFSSLRDENLVLREKPVSSIRPIGRQGYKFDLSCEVALGIDTSETYIASANLKPHQTFSDVFRTFSKIASRSGVAVPGGLTRIANEKSGGCRRYVYHMSGVSVYRDFVRLVFELYNQHLPCSFNTIRLKARSDNRVSIETDVVFTFLE